MNKKIYVVEYAGNFVFQYKDEYGEKTDILNADHVGYESAKLNAESICRDVNRRQEAFKIVNQMREFLNTFGTVFDKMSDDLEAIEQRKLFDRMNKFLAVPKDEQ